MRHGLSWLPFYLHVPVNIRRFRKPTVVMLHGIGASSVIWQRVIDQTEDAHVIAVDLLGFGLSPKPTLIDYTIEDHVMAVRRTLRRRFWRRPVILVGHSLGCLIAIEYARRWPGDIDRLILCSPPLYSSAQKDERRFPKLDDLYMQAYAAARTFKIGEKAVELLSREPKLTGLLVDDATWPSFSKTLQSTIEGQESMLHIVDLKQPIDIIYGRFDSFLIEKNIKSVAKKNPNIKLHKIIAPHSITKGYAKRIIELINTKRR